jgi:hypothetical protein
MSQLDTRAADELVDELATLAGHMSAGMCRWLELPGELIRRGDAALWGHRSCAEWLAWRCGLTPRSAHEHVRVARAVPGLPLIQAAFSRGELSYAKVRALTRVASPEKEPELLELAAAMLPGRPRPARTRGRRPLPAGAEVSRERLWQAGREEKGGFAEPPCCRAARARSHGHLIPPVPPRPPGATTALRDRNRNLGITPKTSRVGYTDRMDLGLTVDYLLEIIGRPPGDSAVRVVVEPGADHDRPELRLGVKPERLVQRGSIVGLEPDVLSRHPFE